MRILDVNKDTIDELLSRLLKRSPTNYTQYESVVADVIAKVRTEGDAAVFAYTKKFDGADINASNIIVTDAEIEEAYREVSPELLDVIRKALVNIRDYHAKQVQNSWFDSKDGIILGQKVTALENVGVYVPGGKAVYPSSVLMNIVPAKVAGVDHIYMCTPCDANGKVYASTLVAAKEAGADKIFKVGGAQAIAAMAFGTESI
ncbi:MAG: histidinol dehydrogenase, partial [Lachnospiraceae bacterium]|nr:histidinol dehydrogenase [Lachnospiraceae bacterium]